MVTGYHQCFVVKPDKIVQLSTRQSLQAPEIDDRTRIGIQDDQQFGILSSARREGNHVIVRRGGDQLDIVSGLTWKIFAVCL